MSVQYLSARPVVSLAQPLRGFYVQCLHWMPPFTAFPPSSMANSVSVTFSSTPFQQHFEVHAGPFLTWNYSTYEVLAPHISALTKCS